ncbi:MAG: AAA family ATPase [Candidatus Puniceispirillaceae bacterium]
MTGFKSFADAAEVEIESGMTGIVGPNGCGKSNIVEGLRWVMGESNARQMRGSEMDDVIFSGTEQRPARNLAEITLRLDNSNRSAPSEFNNEDELEITRKIERGKGSSYFVNARPARAKDVQLLFADSATGARSSGIVSQGRIGAIVGARPVDRRALLEEAANIRGLHARRHEAELRLRGAETNLERLDDVIAGLAEQRDSLRKQARQAARYRSVADRIRKAEAQLLMARWHATESARHDADTALKAAQVATTELTGTAAACATVRTERAAALPALREAEVARAAEYQRLALTRDELDREEARIRDALERGTRQQDQMRDDITRETSLRSDADEAMRRLAEEATALQTQIDDAAPQRDEAAQRLATVREETSQTEAQLADAAAQVRAAAATRQALATRIADLEGRLATAAEALADISLESLEQEVTQTQADFTSAGEAADTARQKLDAAEAAFAEAQQAAEATLAARRDAATATARLQAEIDALSYLLTGPDGSADTPILDSLTVSDGMEKALTAYLAEELAAPAGTGETAYWRGGADAASLAPPDGTLPLTDFVSGAPELATALAGVGVVESASEAQIMQPSLQPGQALTTRDGGLWRWDGFVRRSAAQDSSAERIRQRQRLETLQGELISAAATESAQTDAATAAEDALRSARETLAEQRVATDGAEATKATARQKEESAGLRLDNARQRAIELDDAITGMRADLATANGDAAKLGDDAALAQAETVAREKTEAARGLLAEAMQAESRLAETLRAARDRLASCQQESTQWQQRQAGASSRVEQMQARLAEAEAEQTRLAAMPDEITTRRHEMGDQLDAAEAERQAAADALHLAETALAEAEAAQRDADAALADSREQLIRAEGMRERADESRRVILELISEKLSCTPDGLPELAEAEDAAALPELGVLEDRVQRLIRERDNIGPVNLRAETEMAEVAARIESMEAEAEDLVAAIEKLRAAIAKLNRQGREQLLGSFADVNAHFKELFKILFGGGTAELQLTESDDPLEAGLEILAQPPGKRLQSLSLLSGGEQALTALAIIFAVFLTNPAPICVLDEVDAPLDDTNVTRFCDLLREITNKTSTRFLVITHHRMTMARMDRLFGVTMEQRGISKLVSVDLQTAERIRDAAVA